MPGHPRLLPPGVSLSEVLRRWNLGAPLSFDRRANSMRAILLTMNQVNGQALGSQSNVLASWLLYAILWGGNSKGCSCPLSGGQRTRAWSKSKVNSAYDLFRPFSTPDYTCLLQSCGLHMHRTMPLLECACASASFQILDPVRALGFSAKGFWGRAPPACGCAFGIAYASIHWSGKNYPQNIHMCVYILHVQINT